MRIDHWQQANVSRVEKLSYRISDILRTTCHFFCAVHLYIINRCCECNRRCETFSSSEVGDGIALTYLTTFLILDPTWIFPGSIL